MKGILYCQLKRAPFATPSRRTPGVHGIAEAEDKELSEALKEALEATVALVYDQPIYFSRELYLNLS